MNSIEHYRLDISRAAFTGGASTYPYVPAFGADSFFDDQQGHCESAAMHVATGHVPFGVANQK